MSDHPKQVKTSLSKFVIGQTWLYTVDPQPAVSISSNRTYVAGIYHSRTVTQTLGETSQAEDVRFEWLRAPFNTEINTHEKNPDKHHHQNMLWTTI